MVQAGVCAMKRQRLPLQKLICWSPEERVRHGKRQCFACQEVGFCIKKCRFMAFFRKLLLHILTVYADKGMTAWQLCLHTFFLNNFA